jgi:hypothetical protein
MFPFTPHTTLRLDFGLGGSFFLNKIAIIRHLRRFVSIYVQAENETDHSCYVRISSNET